MNNLKDFEEFNELNEDDSYLNDLKERVIKKEKIIEVYGELTDVFPYNIEELIEESERWDVPRSEVIDEALGVYTEADKMQYIISYAVERCNRVAFYEEFNDFDWGEVNIEEWDIINEDFYEGIELDISGDGSNDYEQAHNREEIREMFAIIKAKRLEFNSDWDPEDEDSGEE